MEIFDTFKEKLHSVQQDLSDGFKTLSMKAREVSRSRSQAGELHYQYPDGSLSRPFKIDAGAELLNKFHLEWGEIHRDIEVSAEKAVVIDNRVQDIFLNYQRRAEPLLQFQRQVQDLPKMVEQIQSITVAISKLEADFEEVESLLMCYEDLCDKMELQKNKKTQLEELSKYKEQKQKEEDLQKANLQEEYNQKLNELKRREDAKLKERQKAFQDVFSADMDHYRIHGKMERPIAEPSEKSVSSLEEFDLSVEVGDQEALNDFLGTDKMEETEDTTEDDKDVTMTSKTLGEDDKEDAGRVQEGSVDTAESEDGGERRISSVSSREDESEGDDNESGILGDAYVPEVTGPIEVQSDAEDIEEEDFATPEASTPETVSDSEDTEEERPSIDKIVDDKTVNVHSAKESSELEWDNYDLKPKEEVDTSMQELLEFLSSD